MFAKLQFSKIDNNELAARNEINRSIFVDMRSYRILGNVLPAKYQGLIQVVVNKKVTKIRKGFDSLGVCDTTIA